MEQQLSFVVKLSLEEMALRRYFINLWCETDVLATIERQKFRHLDKGQLPFDCREISNNLLEKKISNLAMPESLKKRMLFLIKPVGTDIVRWKVFHESNFNWPCDYLNMDILKQLCWTSAGTVDYSKTAEKLLFLDGVSAETRYKLAAVYCLDDYIQALWDELPGRCKERYLSESPFVRLRVKLDFYWAYILTGQESALGRFVAPLSPGDSFLQASCKYSALSGNKGAAEYFLKKLTDAERSSFSVSLVHSLILNRESGSGWRLFDFPIEKVSEVVCFLLTQMSAEQQKNVLSDQPSKLLRCFLDWPLQGLFLELFDVFQQFLSEGDYVFIIESITKNMEHKDHYFPDFLQELFRISPVIFKDTFVTYYGYHFVFFGKIFNADDTQTIKSIFESLGPDRRLSVISKDKFFTLFEVQLRKDKYHLVKFCLKETLQSEDQIRWLRRTYMELLKYYEESRRRQWQHIFRDISKDFEIDNSKSDIFGVTGAKRPCMYNLRSSKRMRYDMD